MGFLSDPHKNRLSLSKHAKAAAAQHHAVARAVARMNTLLEYALPLVKKGGEFFAYKSLGKEEMDEAKNACFLLGGSGIETYPYSLPEGYGERLIAAVKKEKITPQKYPRGNGKERKQPL